jgi:hypothetical protein
MTRISAGFSNRNCIKFTLTPILITDFVSNITGKCRQVRSKHLQRLASNRHAFSSTAGIRLGLTVAKDLRHRKLRERQSRHSSTDTLYYLKELN